MNRIALIVKLILIFPALIYSQEIDINERNDGLDLSISNISGVTSLEKTRDGLIRAELNGNHSSAFNPSDRFAIEEFRFLIALPGGDISMDHRLLPPVKFGKFDIDNNPLFEETHKGMGTDHVEIIRIGEKRGVGLALLFVRPFVYDLLSAELSVIDDFQISLDFERNISLEKRYDDPKELLHFTGVLNNVHLRSLLYEENNASEKDNVVHTNDGWYDPDKDYLKIITTRDGLALIDGSEIIEKSPEYRGKEIIHFHLIKYGEEVPLEFLEDDNDILDENDIIIFTGSRPRADTTWLDPYSSIEAYYFYYDETSEGRRFGKFEQTSPEQNIIEYVFQDMHFEQEHEYIFGYETEYDPDIVNIEKVPGEGWMWDIISPYQEQVFEYDFLGIPYEGENNKIKTSVLMESWRYNRQRELHHQISFEMNNDTVEIYEFPGEQRYRLEHDLDPSWFIPGINNLYLHSLGYLDPSPHNYKIIPDEIAVDYFELSGKFVPFAFRGKAAFRTAELTRPSFLKVPGFRDNIIAVVDTLENTLDLPYSEGGSSIALGSRSGRNPFTSILLNDSLYVSYERGLHVAILKTPDYLEYDSVYYSEDRINEATEFISSLPQKTMIAVAYNGTSQLPSSFVGLMGTLGSVHVGNAMNDRSWAFAARIGYKNNKLEDISDGGIAGRAGFLMHENGASRRMNMLLAPGKSHELIINDLSSMEKAGVENVVRSDLRNVGNQADVILLTHEKFIEFAGELKSWRQQTHPEFNLKIIEVEDVFKEFGYGKKSPHAIKNMLRYALEHWQKPAPGFLTLIGDASWDARMVRDDSEYEDYVPTYGTPVSDHWYGVMGNEETISDLAIGRIPLKSEQEGFDYLEKLREYESVKNNPWMKNFFYMSGGYDEYQRTQFATDMRKNAEIIKNSTICADTFLLKKRNFDAVAEIEAQEIIQRINSGMMLSSYLGHGSATLLEIEGWHVERLNNKGKYGFMSFMSCNTGAFAEPNLVARNEDYLLYPKKGFVGVGGGTTTGFAGSIVSLYDDFMETLVDPELEFTSYAEIMNHAKSLQYGTYYNTVVSNTFSFLGDPLAEIRIEKKPDLYALQDELRQEISENVIFDTDSTVILGGNIYNMGTRVEKDVEVLLIRENELYPVDSLWLTLNGICIKDYIEFEIDVFEKPGRHRLTLIIDPNEKINDVKRGNNKISFSFDVFSQGLLPLEPLAYWDMPLNDPVFRFINPSEEKEKARYEFRIQTAPDTSNAILISGNENIEIAENYVEWTPEIELNDGELYWVSAVAIYDDLKKTSSYLNIPFRAKNDFEIEYAHWSQKEISSLADSKLEGLSLENIAGEARIFLDKREIPFEVLSVHGGPVVPRDAEIKVGDKYYITSPPDNLGFNIVVLDSLSLKPVYIKHFDTRSDSLAPMRLVSFLRDSVKKGDYLMLALLDESFRWIAESGRYGDGSGSWDTIKTELRKYGSALCDSIKQRDYPYWWSWGYSFAMVGKLGAKPGTIVEAIHYESDTAYVTGSFIRYDTLGTFTSRTIGPAREWISLRIDGLMPKSKSNTNVEVYGISAENFREELLLSFSNRKVLDLNSISALEYPFIKIKVKMERASGEAKPYISGIFCDFIPTAELAMIKSKADLSDSELMRGEKVSYHYELENISLRQYSSETVMITTIESDNSIIDEIFHDIGKLQPREIAEIDQDVLTDDFANENRFSAVVNDPVEQNEIYYFNNEQSPMIFDIYEDTSPPWMEMTIDGIEAEDGMYVAIKPYIDLKIFDDSRLPLDNIEYIEFRINGGWVELDEADLISYGRQVNEKASLGLRTDSLEFGENIITVNVSDMTGNTGTYEVRVNVSQNGFIRNMTNIPNPFEDETTFQFDYHAPRQGAMVNLKIYNSTGQIIRELSKDIAIGKNELFWDGRDRYGNSLPTGAYFYNLNVRSDLFVENVTGKVLVVR